MIDYLTSYPGNRITAGIFILAIILVMAVVEAHYAMKDRE